MQKGCTMSQPPVPLSRSTVSTQALSSVDKPVKSSSTSQSLIWPPQKSPHFSTPPPVAPKPWAVERSSGNVEFIKIQHILLRQLPPLLPAQKEELDDENETWMSNLCQSSSKTGHPGIISAKNSDVKGFKRQSVLQATFAHDKKKINKILRDFSSLFEDILTCLRFINEGMDQLKLHGLSVLSKSQMGSDKAAKVVDLAMEEGSGLTSETRTKASGMISGFALGIDIYFTKDKDGHKVKKGLVSKLAKKICTLSEDLDKGYKELVKIKELFSKP